MAKYSLKSARHYAKALFESCEISELDNVQSALDAAVSLFYHNELLNDALSNPSYPLNQRLEVVEAACRGSNISETKVINILKLLTEHKKLVNLNAIGEIFKKMIEALRKELSVEIHSAFEISSDELNDIKGSFQKVSGGLASIETKIDKELIGGLKIKVGDRVLDNSIQGALNKFSEVI